MSSDHPVRVVQFGLGPIGLACAREVLARRGSLELAGAVDVDPQKAGHDLGDLLGSGETGIVISGDAEALLASARPAVVLHTAGSALETIRDQLEGCLRAGAHVISSSEELLWPFERHPDLSRALDDVARDRGVVLLGTGVNPGFVMDTLAVVATAACVEVRSVEARRVVDASKRRGPLQRKVGAGLSLEAFEARKREGTVGHVGIRESLLFVAAGLGWELERVDEGLEPVVADAPVETEHVTVEPGSVAGVHHTAHGWIGRRRVLALDLQMYVGARNPQDAVRVEGEPPIDLIVRGGVFGDTATVGALVNAIPRVADAAPGLRTLLDLPLPRAGA